MCRLIRAQYQFPKSKLYGVLMHSFGIGSFWVHSRRCESSGVCLKRWETNELIGGKEFSGSWQVSTCFRTHLFPAASDTFFMRWIFNEGLEVPDNVKKNSGWRMPQKFLLSFFCQHFPSHFLASTQIYEINIYRYSNSSSGSTAQSKVFEESSRAHLDPNYIWRWCVACVGPPPQDWVLNNDYFSVSSWEICKFCFLLNSLRCNLKA